MNATMAKPIQSLRIEQRKYYTRIYLGVALLFSIHHVAEAFAADGESLEGTARFYITELGIAEILLPGTERNFATRKKAEQACIHALKGFRTDLCQLNL